MRDLLWEHPSDDPPWKRLAKSGIGLAVAIVVVVLTLALIVGLAVLFDVIAEAVR